VTVEHEWMPVQLEPQSRSSAAAEVETRSIGQVPLSERHGRVRDQFTLWFALNANIFVLVLGGALVLMGLDLVWAAIAAATGTIIGLALVGLHAVQGPVLGVPQMIQSRAQFGFYGAVLVFVVSVVLDVGFLAAQLAIQADAMHLLVGSISVTVWIALLTLPVIVLTIYGYNLIHRYQRWLTVVLAITFVVILVRALERGAQVDLQVSGGPPSFALFTGGVTLFVVTMVSWAPYVSDYSRYLPRSVSRTRLFWSVFAGCAVPTVFCATLGAYVTSLVPDESSTVAAVSSIAGRWTLPVMALSLIGSNVANSYTGMLTLVGIASCFKDVRRSVSLRVVCSFLLVALGGVFAFLLGYSELVSNLSQLLNLLLYVLIPWSAINLVDYYLVNRGEYDVASFFTPHGRYGPFRWPALVAYLLAVAVQVPFMDQGFYRGPLVAALGGVDVSWVVGAVAGVVLYLVALRAAQARSTPMPH
jgi:NCS1 family nucleobase:cation symporter-1